MSNVTPVVIAVLVAELVPAAAFGFAAERDGASGRALAACPARGVCRRCWSCLTSSSRLSQHMFRWQWFALYAALPVVMAWLLARAAAADPEQRGNWRDAVILLTLGLAVDLRWFDVAWPAGLRGLDNLLLVDAGLYGFLAIRRLSGTGFDFHLHWSDWKTGLRELAVFRARSARAGTRARLHPSACATCPRLGKAVLTWAGIFVFVAVPEELFFRAWVQNLLERRVGRRAALVIASVLFGLSHFNKRSGALQLALCSAGHDRRNFLRPRLARAAARAGLDHHAHLCGLAVVVVVLGELEGGGISRPRSIPPNSGTILRL